MFDRYPVVVNDFRDLRRHDCYTVDKTRFIAEFMAKPCRVSLFMRPGRFGKSLNLSMLDAYLNSAYKGNWWFEDTEIETLRPGDEERNANTVVYLEMAAAADTFEDFLYKLRDAIERAYVRLGSGRRFFPELARPGILFPDIVTPQGREKLSRSLTALTAYAHRRYGKKVILLVDDYDHALRRVGEQHAQQTVEFLNIFLGEALRDRTHLKFAVLTGQTCAEKDILFAGVRGMRINGMLDNDFGDCFGFTEDEISRICLEHECVYKDKEIREWFGGYRIGGHEMYNPWSVVIYVASGFEPKSYRNAVRESDAIDTAVSGGDRDVFRDLSVMAGGGEVFACLSPDAEAVSECGADSLYSVMVALGYLRTVRSGDGYLISIPNREIYEVFAARISSHLEKYDWHIREIRKASDSLDPAHLDVAFYGFAETFDFQSVYGDYFFDRLLLALRFNLPSYEVRLTMDSYARTLIFRSKVWSLPHAVIQFVPANDRNPEGAAKSALDRIRNKAVARLDTESILMYGVGFNQRSSHVVCEKYER